eukprot:1159739-Pelagomonas_calceolata.AAC.8
MPATKPDLSLKLKERLEVYNCFSVAKKQRYIGSIEDAQTVSRIIMPHPCTLLQLTTSPT